MPKSQVAAVSNYDVNFPVGAAAADQVPVLALRSRFGRGGKITFRIEPTSGFGGENEDAESDVEVSIEVSADGVTFTPTTAANNGVAVTDEAIPALTHGEFEINLRQGLDNVVRVQGRGTDRGSRVHIQVRGNSDLDLVFEGQDLSAKGPTGP